MKRPELDYATDATAEFLRELVRLRSAGLLPELQPFAKVVDLEAGYLARAFRTAILEAVRWARDNPPEPPVDYVTPLREPVTAPPPAGWDPLEKTPSVPEDDYPQIEMSEVDFADCDTSPQTPRALVGRPGRTLPSWRPPPPPAGRHGPPPLPDVPSSRLKQIRDRRKR